jgi:hypothetical protein
MCGVRCGSEEKTRELTCNPFGIHERKERFGGRGTVPYCLNLLILWRCPGFLSNLPPVG